MLAPPCVALVPGLCLKGFPPGLLLPSPGRADVAGGGPRSEGRWASRAEEPPLITVLYWLGLTPQDPPARPRAILLQGSPSRQGQAGSSGPSAGSQSTASSGALSWARSWRGSWRRGKGALPLPLAEASFSKGHSLPSATRLRKRTSWEERGQAVSDWGFRTGAHGNRSEKGCSA